MKTRLSLAMIMISVCAWAMPSAEYIPADAAAVMTVYAPHESTVVKDWNAFATQNKDSSFLKAMSTFDLYILKSYGVSPEMQGDVVMVDILGDDEMSVMFIEGTFDVDIVLAKIRQSPDALGELFREEGMVCGKILGGIYICSEPMGERVKALLAGKEEPISPTSAFAKLVNEKNDPNRFAIRFLGKGGKGGLKQLRESDTVAVKASLIEHTPGVVGIDATLYAKSSASITRMHTQMQGLRMVMSSSVMGTPALAQFVNQIEMKVDAAKKRLTMSHSLKVKDFEILQEAFAKFVGPRLLIDNVALTTSPTFKVEKWEDFVDDWKVGDLNSPRGQSKTFTIEGHRVTVTARTMYLHLSETPFWTSSSMSTGVDHADDPERLANAKAGIEWEVVSPTNVEIKEMHVTQGDRTFEFNSVGSPFINQEEGTQCVSGQMIGRPTGDVDIAFEYRIIPLFKTSSVFQVGKLEDFFDNKEGKTLTIEGHTVAISAKKTSMGEEPSVIWKLTFPNDLEIKDMDVVSKDEEYGTSKHTSRDLRSYDGMRRMTVTTSGYPTGDVGIEFHYRNWTGCDK